MGGKRGRIQRRHFKQSRDNVWKRPRVEGSSEAAETFSQDQWEPLVTQNEAFEQYYKEQGILCEQEWEQFIAILQKSLPATFRINSSALFCGDILLQLENDFLASLTAEDTCGNMIEQMRPLPWYPNKFAWHLNYSRSQLRKNRTLERFHEFLKLENEIGNITRQEAVSMVPPLFLDVQPQHYILDMCAAPGSKTFQLLEMIHKPDSLACLPAGLVIANDVDVQRCNLLIHQTKRMCSANLIVTNHEAQHFPSCHSKDRSMMVDSIAGNEDSAIAHLNQSIDKGTMSHLLFDRILCDVPCSGDGTIRKAPDIWRKWNTGLGNGVHKLQVQIAMRGVSLLKVGGRLVYSTCSMNPVENEAVVAEVLRQSQGSLELLDVSSELPDLKRRPGLKCWKVRDRGKWLSSYRQVDRHRRYTILPSMFPSGATFNDGLQMDVAVDQKEVDGSKNKDEVPCKDLKADVFNGCSGDHGNLTADLEGMLLEKNNSEVDNCEAETSSLPLERCMRIVPHDQDTGAFFVAVLKKVSHLSVENAKSTATRKGSTRESKQDTKDQVMSNVQMGSNETNVHANDEEKEETDVDSRSYAKKSIESQVSEKESGKNEGENLNVIPDVENNAITEMNTTAMPDNQRDKRMPQQQSRWRGIDPVLFFTDESSINSIKDFYGIDHTCALLGHLVVRNSELTHPKRIYYVSSSVRDVIKLNIHAGQQLKIASIGLKVFERQTLKEGTSQCMYRISSEGLPLLLPYLKKQIIYVPLLDLVLLLSRRSINFKTFQDQRVQSEALNLLPGCCVVALNKDDAGVPSEVLAPIAVVCWKGKTSLSLMVSKSESEELLERLAFKYGKDIVNGIMLNENTRCISEGEDTILSNDAQEDIPEI